MGLKDIKLTPTIEQALDRMEHSYDHVFITGKAGTGKSTLLTYFRKHTKKQIAVLAPTGVAALNVEGETIHSFFGFTPDVTLQKIKRLEEGHPRKQVYKTLDSIVIDEVSMVRADLMDCMDKFLRLNGRSSDRPFGGVQMIFVGDLHQLPPVVTPNEHSIFETLYDSPYFFSAHTFVSLQTQLFSGTAVSSFQTLTLDKTFRQADQTFIDILNGVRTNTISNEQIQVLNTRLQPKFVPDTHSFWITITTTNQRAHEINAWHLEQLKGTGKFFQAIMAGEVDPKQLPGEPELYVKKGAQIMMISNDRQGRWVNGTMGKVIRFDVDAETQKTVVVVELETGVTVEVLPHTWDVFRFMYDASVNHIISDTIGSFTQYPFRLAWAVTIHKSQGKTFDQVIVDFDRGTFASGQAYVALSRCRSLEGIVLRKPFLRSHIKLDKRIEMFIHKTQTRS